MVAGLTAEAIDVVALTLDRGVALLEDGLEETLVLLALTGHVGIVSSGEAVDANMLRVSEVAAAASHRLVCTGLIAVIKRVQQISLANTGVLHRGWARGLSSRCLGLGNHNLGISDRCCLHNLRHGLNTLRVHAATRSTKAARADDEVTADRSSAMRMQCVILAMSTAGEFLL
jgi:hypothetical protein